MLLIRWGDYLEESIMHRHIRFRKAHPTMNSTPNPVRVRLAPSPTGNLHVGTARTALFNALFARHYNGTFILRVEDTDRERSKPEYTQNIFDGLKALGLNWQEGPDVGGTYGPYTQSEREAIYTEHAHRLLEKGLAYWDYTTPEELTAMREQATQQKKPFIYRHNGNHEPREGVVPSLRFRIPAETPVVTVGDEVRGSVPFETNLLGDFVILKADGSAAFNFACVIDDHLMEISHVIRGEDHLPNTPKQLLLYQAFGWQPPKFAHLGMILAPDRSKLSKRHGATACDSFMNEEGYLPEAFINFLALLGWSAPGEEEIMSMERLVELFSLERVGHSGAIFDREKLNWMNGQYIRQLDDATLLEKLKPFMQGLSLDNYTHEQQRLMVSILKEPLHTLSQIREDASYFFGEDVERDSAIVEEVLANDAAISILRYMQNDWLPTADLTSVENAQASIKALTKALANDHKTKTVMWTLRAALTGRVRGADLASTLFLLGAPRIQHRLATAVALAHQAVQTA
jgi:nondiscriminating glutamyl-tRNA synthetase